MKKLLSFFKHIDFILNDFILFFLSFVLSNLIYLKSLNFYNIDIYKSILSVLVISLSISMIVCETHKDILRRNNINELVSTLKCAILAFIITTLLLYLLKMSNFFSRIVLFLTFIIFVITSSLSHYLLKKILIERINANINSLMIVSDSNNIKSILENINKEKIKEYNIKGICLIDKRKGYKIGEYQVNCLENEIYDYVINNNISDVLYALEISKVDCEIVSKLTKNGVAVNVRTKNIYGFNNERETIDKIGIFNTYKVNEYKLSISQDVYLYFKRIFDIFFATIGMVFVAIVSIIVKAINLLNSDRGPLFYKQTRIGKDGKKFKMYKFRTMCVDADEKLKKLLKKPKYRKEWESYHKINNDPRITKFGEILRKTSLDELPQFVNVIKGEMSIIGPRPLSIGELDFHQGLKLYEKIKPGITGWWACNGRSNINYEERLEQEYYYVRNFSLLIDLLIVFRTVYCVIKKTGAK